jgi:hypothetical protein
VRFLIRRPARIVRHPVGYLKRSAPPRTIRHALHPVTTAEARGRVAVHGVDLRRRLSATSKVPSETQ